MILPLSHPIYGFSNETRFPSSLQDLTAATRYAPFKGCRRRAPGLRPRARRHADAVNVSGMVKPLLEEFALAGRLLLRCGCPDL
jgi:hypothetical protein